MGGGLPPYKRQDAMETAALSTPFMVRLCLAVIALVLALGGSPARADGAASAWFVTDQGRVRLIAAQPFVGADKGIELGLEFELAPHWKIYWRTPGDAGFPPHLDWRGSSNLAVAALDWPAPRRFSVLGFETAGYEDTIVLPIPAQVAAANQALTAHVALQYLTCNDICIPYETTLELNLPAAPVAGERGFGPLIARFAARVPGDGRAVGLGFAGATLRPGKPAELELAVRTDRPLGRPDAFVEGAAGVGFGAPVPRAGGNPNETVLRIPVLGPSAAIAGLVGKTLTVTLVDGERAMMAPVVPTRGPPTMDLAALWPMLLVALIGGLVLNVMPCVLPVLSLKLVGAIEHRERPLRAVRAGFLATAAGILLSFLALALVMVALTRAGAAVGWGVQFQEPIFLVAMAAVLTLFAANLWGLFEVPLPRAVADLAGRAALGNVATGAFATLLATPCSAPFLGTALGFRAHRRPGRDRRHLSRPRRRLRRALSCRGGAAAVDAPPAAAGAVDGGAEARSRPRARRHGGVAAHGAGGRARRGRCGGAWRALGRADGSAGADAGGNGTARGGRGAADRRDGGAGGGAGTRDAWKRRFVRSVAPLRRGGAGRPGS